MSTVEQLRVRMVDRLVAEGHLRTEPWIAAFRQVPRHAFLPRFFRQSDDLSGWEAITVDDPGAVEMIYDTATWVVQLDHDPHRWQAARDAGKPIPGVPTSSSTAPGLMALMLEALDVHDGHHVLEIGTGTGYHAALLAERLGSAQVITVEVDPDLAGAAATSLHAAGYTPQVVTGDGSDGHPGGGPYDRLIATVASPTIPRAWVGQVRPGGLILASLHRDLGGGPLALLRVDETGRAEGRFLPDYGGFMPVRAHPLADADQRLTAALATPPITADATAAIGPDVLDGGDFGMVAALRLPGVTTIWFIPDTGPQLWLLAGDGSWACFHETARTVRQQGPRRLWDEVEALHRRWVELGSPGRDRFGITATPDREWLWLDTPDQPVS